uniref:Uncharacterized protein n=1 Tax=Romanomermis culicivorax TaxID=13658 RepID=A0A915IKE8_ROMCU
WCQLRHQRVIFKHLALFTLDWGFILTKTDLRYLVKDVLDETGFLYIGKANLTSGFTACPICPLDPQKVLKKLPSKTSSDAISQSVVLL